MGVLLVNVAFPIGAAFWGVWCRNKGKSEKFFFTTLGAACLLQLALSAYLVWGK